MPPQIPVPSSSATPQSAGGGFARRALQLTVQLAPRSGTTQPTTFAGTGSDTALISSSSAPNQLRVAVHVENSGSPAACTADVRVWGLPPNLTNQLSTLGLKFNLVPKNSLTVAAGNYDAQGNPANLSTVFSGTIQYAYADYKQMPDVPFVMHCLLGLSGAVQSIPPSSFPGTSDVAQVMSGLARQMNLGFQNYGVDAKMRNLYLRGSAKQQADTLARWARIKWGYLSGGSVMGIWPAGQSASQANAQVPVISRATGMITAPAFTQGGIVVETLFNPQISYGTLVSVQSDVLAGIARAAAQSGGNTFPQQWAAYKVNLDLAAEVPGGDWKSTIWAYNPAGSPVIPQAKG